MNILPRFCLCTRRSVAEGEHQLLSVTLSSTPVHRHSKSLFIPAPPFLTHIIFCSLSQHLPYSHTAGSLPSPIHKVDPTPSASSSPPSFLLCWQSEIHNANDLVSFTMMARTSLHVLLESDLLTMLASITQNCFPSRSAYINWSTNKFVHVFSNITAFLYIAGSEVRQSLC